MKQFVAIIVLLGGAAAAHASTVTVTATGTVVFNGITAAPLSAVGGGESATMSFEVDSGNFVDGVPGDTRGYLIDPASFVLAFGGGTSVGLLDPFPSGQTPYFTLVEGFPVSDGFFVSTSPVSPGGVPLSQSPYNFSLDLGYVGSTLSSLDILDAVGTYDFGGLTRFGFDIWRVVPDNVVLGIDFAQLVITPEPASLVLLALGGVFAIRRRR